MGIGHGELTADFVPYPQAKLPAWLSEALRTELERLGPDFTVALFGRRALRRATQDPFRLRFVKPPFDGPRLTFAGPLSLREESRTMAASIFPKSRGSYADFVRAAVAELVEDAKTWPARPYESMGPLCQVTGSPEIYTAIFTHLKAAGESNLSLFLRESLWQAVKHPGELPPLPDNYKARKLTVLRAPEVLRQKVLHLSNNPSQFTLRAAILRLTLFDALPDAAGE